MLALAALLIAWTVLSIFIALHRHLRWTNEVQQRLVASLRSPVAQPQIQRTLVQPMNRRIRQLAIGNRLEHQLAASHINLTVTEYFFIQVGISLCGLLIGWFASGYLLSGIVLAGVCWMLPGTFLRHRQQAMAKKFAAQLPDMLSMLIGSLQAGYGLLHAFRVIQQEMPDPMATEFEQVLKETMLGYSINEALDHFVGRIANEDLDLIVTSIHIQTEVGGSLAEVLSTISGTIRERIKILGEIQAMTSQQRLTGWMMTLMPFGLALIMMLFNPEYIMGLFEPGWTLVIPIIAIVMVVLGNIAMRMLIKIEV